MEADQKNTGCHEVRTVWHDLRADPDDLPEPYRDVWGCICIAKFRVYQTVTYRKEDRRWTSPSGKVDYTGSVAAWCEYPVFGA